LQKTTQKILNIAKNYQKLPNLLMKKQKIDDNE